MKEERIAKLREELLVIAKRKSSSAYGVKVERVRNAITIKPSTLQSEMVFKVNKFQLIMKGMALLTLVVFFGFSLIMFIRTGTYYPSHFVFILFMGIVAVYRFMYVRKVRVTLDRTGIGIGKDWVTWDNVLECFVAQYPIRIKYRRCMLYVALESGELKQYNVSGINDIALSHYIYHYMKTHREEIATSVQPS